MKAAKTFFAGALARVGLLFVPLVGMTMPDGHGLQSLVATNNLPTLGEVSQDCIAVHRYFPMHDGDVMRYQESSSELTITTTATTFNGFSVFEIGTVGGREYMSYSGTRILLWGESALGFPDVVFKEPIVWLDEDLVLNGGTRTSHTTADVFGYTAKLTLTVTVTKLGAVTVPAGTFGNCRQLSMTLRASIAGQGSGTTRKVFVFSPGVGTIRMTPTDELTVWQELLSGTVEGVDVSVLSEWSHVASPAILRQPLARNSLTGTLVDFYVTADGSGPFSYQWTRNGTNLVDGERLTGATNVSLQLADLRAEDAGEYAVQVLNAVGCITSTGAMLTAIPDHTRPSLTITSPLPNSRTSNAVTLVQGKATDNACVGQVFYQLNDGAWEAASGTTNWQASVGLFAGTNVLRAYAIDPSGNRSATNLLHLNFVVTSPLDLSVSGEGSVSPDLYGQELEVGRAYTVTAAPARGWLFSNWVGNVESSLPRLSFVMESNLTLHANFVTNPFVGLKGSYGGLFYDTNAPSHFNAGLFTLTLTDKGSFSARLQQGAAKYSFSGQFDLALSVQTTVPRKGTNDPVVSLQLTGGSDRVVGLVSNVAWSSELFGYRADFNSRSNPATNVVGNYNLHLPGAEDSADGPMGHGFAQLGVNSGGSMSFKGTLGDGTAAAQKMAVAVNGQWPFYASLYSGKGSAFGWLTLINTTTNDITGRVLWIKPGGLKGALYPAGFTNELESLGSRYVAPATGGRVLDFSNAVVVLDGGNLSPSQTNNVMLTERSQVVVDAPNAQKLSLKLTVSSGAMSGSFNHPQKGKPAAIKGVLLRKQNVGAGFFPGTTQSGRVFLGELERE